MSVMLETSLGDLIIDLEVERCPRTCENFLKLCKIKYYALNAFFNVSKDFIAQTGDPTATGTGGSSLEYYLASLSPGSSSRSPTPPRYFPPEFSTKLKHTSRGTVSMAVAPTDPPGCGSQFFITLTEKIEYLDGKHVVFGHVIEGMDTLDKINEAYLDKEGRPLQDIRIRHVEVLEDPFPDPANLIPVPTSPTRPPDANPSVVRISDTENPYEQLPEEQVEATRRKTAAASSALTLEMIGDIPFAAVRPPENILFVCKLNPVTQDEDLELIFSRFGKILSCEVVRDKKSGDSLQYAFIEFDERESAEQAYFKMQNVLVDDRRIWVDFSQSVAKMNVATLTSKPRGRGGFGGSGRGGRGGGPGRGGSTYVSDNGYGGGSGLKESSRYAHGGARASEGYGMVFDGENGSGNGNGDGDGDGRASAHRKRSRSRSPRRSNGHGRHRDRSRSRERYRDERGDRPKDRERDRDGHRYSGERKDGHRHRDERDKDRERYRDRDDRDRRR